MAMALVVLLSLPLLYVQLFTLVSRALRWCASLTSIGAVLLLGSLNPSWVGMEIFVGVMVLLVVYSRQWYQVADDVHYRDANELPPLMRDVWELNLWFNPVWFVLYRLHMYRDPKTREEIEDNGYHVPGVPHEVRARRRNSASPARQ
jgi:hypothetical protein